MGNKLYVGNLPYSFRDEDLLQAFAVHGTVTSAKVMMERDTGRSKGFGFVEMGSDAEAQAAINGVNGQQFGGRGLVVNEARPMEPRPPPLRRLWWWCWRRWLRRRRWPLRWWWLRRWWRWPLRWWLRRWRWRWWWLRRWPWQQLLKQLLSNRLNAKKGPSGPFFTPKKLAAAVFQELQELRGLRGLRCSARSNSRLGSRRCNLATLRTCQASTRQQRLFAG